jgi:hypothetical protein
MVFDPTIASNPYTWAFLVGCPFGAALAVLTVLPGRTRNPEKTRRAKPSRIFLLLTVAVAAAAVSVFQARPAELFTGRVFTCLGFVVGVAFLVVRFKKTAGSAALIALVLFSVASRSALSGWTRLDAPTALAELSLVAAGGSVREFKLRIGARIEMASVRSNESDPIKTAFLLVDEAYFMLGRSPWVRIEAIGDWQPSGRDDGAQFLGWFLLLPGVSLVKVAAALPPLDPYRPVLLLARPDRTLQVVEK